MDNEQKRGKDLQNGMEMSGAVSGNGSVVVGGVAGNGAAGVAGGDSGTGMVSGNGAERRGEALEGGSSVGVGYEGGLSEEPLKTAENGLLGQNGELAGVNLAGSRGAQGVTTGVQSGQASAINTQSAKQKSHKKMIVWVVAVVALLVAGGVAAWAVLLGQEENELTGDVGGDSVVDSMPEPITGEPGEGSGKDTGNADDAYGYAIACFEPGDGSFYKRCDAIELHKGRGDVILASYINGDKNEDGRVMGGGASFPKIVNGHFCYLNDYIFGEYNFQTYEALSCIDLSSINKKPQEILVVESDNYETLDYTYTMTDKYVFYHSGRFASDAEMLRYDIETGETVNTHVPYTSLYYDKKSGQIISMESEGDERFYYGRDDMLNVITDKMTEAEFQQRYPELYDEIFVAYMEKEDYIYVGGEKAWIDSETKDVHYGDKVIYDYPDNGNGSVGFKYDPNGEKVVVVMSDECGGQTCGVFQTITHDVKTGKMDVSENDLGYKYWDIKILL